MSRGLRYSGKEWSHTSSQQYRLASPSRRPTLCCVANPEQLATESTRARLIHHHTYPDKDFDHKDFAASYQYTRNYPTYAVTSHANSITKSKPKSVIPAYPMQSFRWNPLTNTANKDSQPDEASSVTCTCENCSGKECSLFEESSNKTDKEKYENNMMTFTDQCTMTPKVADVGCSCNAVSSARNSEVCDHTSDIGARYTCPSMQINEFVPSQYPAPILKKNKNTQPCNCYDNSNFGNYCEDECDPCLKYQEAERDNDRLDRENSAKFWNNRRDIVNRKTVYDEGLCDMVASQRPVNPHSAQLPSKMRTHCSRAAIKANRSLKRFMDEENTIPYSHRSDSRYHQSCKAERKVFFYEDDFGQSLGGPRYMNGQRVKPRCITPPSKLPKRVLTSDKHIEEFIDNSYSMAMPAAARNNN